MPQGTWYGAAAGYLGTWMGMMVPMMLPSLVPMLARYRRSLRGAEVHRQGLTALAGGGYFAVWAVVGIAVYAAGLGVSVVESRWEAAARWLPLMVGPAVIVAGLVQLSPGKARRLALCRDGSGDGSPLASTAPGAWRLGLRWGGRCGLSCGSLMAALLAIGMMNPVAMAAVTLVIWAERLGPWPLRVARVAGVALIGVGALMVAGSASPVHPG